MAAWVYSTLDSLDVDQDGRPDLKFMTGTINRPYTPAQSGYRGMQGGVRNVNPALELAVTAAGSSYVCALAAGDTLQQRIDVAPPYAGYQGIWAPVTGSTAYLFSYSQGAGSGVGGSMFLTGVQYMGFRLRTGTTQRYGWIRLRTIDYYQAHYQVEAYALQAAATPLPTLPASAAAAWQVYPVPATESLTIQPPPTGSGRATLLDALGRQVRPTARLAAGQGAQLPLADLAAGLYLLRVETPAGSFVRRVAKR